MNRRSFSKLLAGTLTAAGISQTNEAEGSPPKHARQAVTSMVPPSGGSDAWELVILDSPPPHMTQTSGTGVADVDGDGKTEVIIAGSGSLVWYRPSSSEKGVIALGEFGVGVALKDINGDGRKEVIVGKLGEGKKWLICWYQSGANLLDPWTEHVLDGEPVGHPHDVVFGDLDGNGKQDQRRFRL